MGVHITLAENFSYNVAGQRRQGQEQRRLKSLSRLANPVCLPVSYDQNYISKAEYVNQSQIKTSPSWLTLSKKMLK